MNKDNINKVLTLIHNNHKYIYNLLEETSIKILQPDNNNACYIYNFSKFFDNIYLKLNLSEEQLNDALIEFKSNLKKNYGKILIFSEKKTFLLLLMIIYFTNINDEKNAMRCNYILLIKHYSLLLRKSLPKGCDQNYFLLASQYLPKTHLFVKKPILYSILDLSIKIYKKYHNYFNKKYFDFDKMITFIYEGRHRINQSLKTFINAYMKAYKNKNKSVTPDDKKMEDKIFNIDKELLSQKIVDKILLNEEISMENIIFVNRVTRVNKNLIISIVKYLQYINSDTLKNIYIYLLNDIKDINLLKDKEFVIKYTRKLMSVKITKKQIYYKKLIYELLYEILNMDKNLNKIYTTVNNNSRYNIALSLSLYLSLYIYKYII